MSLNTNEGWILPYLAGFFDAEGALIVGKRERTREFKWVNGVKTRRKVPKVSVELIIRLAVSNRDPSPLRLFEIQFGGTLKSGKNTFEHWGDIWSWYVQGRQVQRVLTALLPFLVSKRDRVVLLLELFDLTYHTPDGKGYTEQVRQRRQEILKEMDLLTARYNIATAKRIGVNTQDESVSSELTPVGVSLSDDDLKMYLAGFLDGDGHIGVYKNPHFNRPSSATKRNFKPQKRLPHLVHVEVYNRDPKPLQLFAQYFGGNLLQYHYNKSQDGARWQWRRTNEHCLNVIRTLLPHLVVKKEKAEAILKFVPLNYHIYSGETYPEDVEKQRQDLLLHMQELSAKYNRQSEKRLKSMIEQSKEQITGGS